MDKVKELLEVVRCSRVESPICAVCQDLRRDRIGMSIENTLDASIEDARAGWIEKGRPDRVKAWIQERCADALARSCTS